MAYLAPSSRRALAALAALGLTKSELSELMDLFRSSPVSYIRSLISDIERQLIEADIYDKPDETNSRDRHDVRSEQKIAYQIYQQLKNELKLNNGEIIYYFSEMLHHEIEKVTLPEFDSKRGLVRWLIEVIGLIGPSRTLQISARIRNAILHSKRPSWSVRDEDEFL